MRGNAFEARVTSDGGAELMRLLGVESGRFRVPELTAAGPEGRAARTSLALREAVADGGWSLLRHPMLMLEVAGSPAYLEPDAVVVHPDGRWTVVEIKSFPMIDGAADPAKVGSAARQAAVYVLALERVAAHVPGAEAGTDVLLVCPKDFSNLPTGSWVDVRKQRAVTARQLRRLTRIEDIAAALPQGCTFDPERPAEELTAAVEAVTAVYAPDCLASCELAFHCRERARDEGGVTALGRSVRGELGGLTTVGEVLAAARGESGDPADPAVVALRRAAALRAEALDRSRPTLPGARRPAAPGARAEAVPEGDAHGYAGDTGRAGDTGCAEHAGDDAGRTVDVGRAVDVGCAGDAGDAAGRTGDPGCAEHARDGAGRTADVGHAVDVGRTGGPGYVADADCVGCARDGLVQVADTVHGGDVGRTGDTGCAEHAGDGAGCTVDVGRAVDVGCAAEPGHAADADRAGCARDDAGRTVDTGHAVDVGRTGGPGYAEHAGYAREGADRARDGVGRVADTVHAGDAGRTGDAGRAEHARDGAGRTADVGRTGGPGYVADTGPVGHARDDVRRAAYPVHAADPADPAAPAAAEEESGPCR